MYTKNYSYRPSSDSTYYYEVIDIDYGYACDTTCKATTTYVVNVYKKVYKTETIIDKTTSTVTCPEGYTKSENTCVKNETSKETTTASCPAEYEKTSDGTKCFKEVEKIEKVTETIDVTYYRYRTREYIAGSVKYKWSTSNNDKKLLDDGYRLTGKTRYV